MEVPGRIVEEQRQEEIQLRSLSTKDAEVTQRVPRGLPQLRRPCKKRWIGPCCGNIPVQFFFFLNKKTTVLICGKTFISVRNIGQKSVRMSRLLVQWQTVFCHPFNSMKNILKYQTFLVNGCYRSQLCLLRDRFFSVWHRRALAVLLQHFAQLALCEMDMNGSGNLFQRDGSVSFMAILVYVPVVILICNGLMR